MQAILSIFSQPAMAYCLNMTIIQTFSLKSTSFGAFFAQKILVCINGFSFVTKWQNFAPKNCCLRVGMVKQLPLYVGCGKH
jgi:hypothetical protein